jgi:phosphoribosylamine--glycine ligase
MTRIMMRSILIVGSGGREHALAWKLAQSSRVNCVFVAPGNGGTDSRSPSPGAPVANVPLSESDFDGLIAFAQEREIELAVIGPEAPLADGIVDAFRAAGIRCFGPSRDAARLETSKVFAKAFMARHGIPTARYAAFTDHAEALAHLRGVDYPVVVKASGLAAGKGVIVPETRAEAEAALNEIMVSRAFGAAGDEVVIEERLSGPEVSLLGFSDGRTVAVMPPCQDHKRVYDGDSGPNTGGMGAYAPALWLAADEITELARLALQPVIEGMAREGTSYVGALYAGLMLTADGPRVLEYNCRFGDPETQVILPLLESDLLDVLDACVDGCLDPADVHWRGGSAVTVVLASEGYPAAYPKGRSIRGLDETAALSGVTVFHAGTAWNAAGEIVTSGGRVLAVTGAGEDFSQARERAYAGVACIHFDGMHYRKDIGARALR